MVAVKLIVAGVAIELIDFIVLYIALLKAERNNPGLTVGGVIGTLPGWFYHIAGYAVGCLVFLVGLAWGFVNLVQIII